MEAVLGALSATDNIIQGAYLLGKGILHPTLPLRAYFTRLSSPSLPRAGHSISIVKGRAYIFGGETSPGKLANNDMHIIILPSSGVSDTDYTVVTARGTEPKPKAVPCARKHHIASVVGDRIYIYGGQYVNKQAIQKEEKGQIWVFDTTTNTWSYLQPEESSSRTPGRRARHAAAASELPPPPQTDRKPDIGVLPQAPPDPAKYLVEPPSPGSYGTLFISGGVTVKNDDDGDDDGDDQGEKLLGDTWTFDIRSKTWNLISEGYGAGRQDAALAIVGQRLYRSGGFDGTRTCDAHVESLDVGAIVNEQMSSEKNMMRKLSLPQSMEGWSTVGTRRGNDDSKVPTARDGAGLLQVTTGQGREYLLLVGGNVQAKSTSDGSRESGIEAEVSNEGTPGDIWAFQLPSAATSAATAKDTTRKAINMGTREGSWAEAQYRYLNAMGDEISPLQAGVRIGQGIEARRGFAVAKGTEVDGATAVVWGGIRKEGEKGEKEEMIGDGWIITVDR